MPEAVKNVTAGQFIAVLGLLLKKFNNYEIQILPRPPHLAIYSFTGFWWECFLLAFTFKIMDKIVKNIRTKHYKVIRLIEEVYDVDAKDKKDAKFIVAMKGDPSSVTVIKEVIHLQK